MPILTTGGQPPTPTPETPSLPSDLLGYGAASAIWTSPSGESWNLTDDPFVPGVITLPGVAGIGGAPRSTVRRALSTGGTMPRWSFADERLITWPVLVAADGRPDDFLILWRRFIRAFTATTPPAGLPETGTLRITRADGTWRESAAIYEAGLNGNDPVGMGLDKSMAVITLIAPDPWWYGPEQVAITFAYTLTRAYVGTTGGGSGTDPYETVSPSNAQGSSDVIIEGDVPALPTWILTGPASSFTVAVPGAYFTYNAALLAGEQVVVDVGRLTVATPAGVNKIGNLSWPGSSLFPLQPGAMTAVITINGAAAGAGVQLIYRPRWDSA